MNADPLMAWLACLKPVVARRSQMLVAAILWSSVGTLLLCRGVQILIVRGQFMWFAVALVLGLIKARMILDRSATKIAERIGRLKERSCLGAMYSWKTCIWVVLMIIAGRLLRISPLPILVLGVIYTAIGEALFLSSRILWQHWRS